jgi:hypothetical protein
MSIAEILITWPKKQKSINMLSKNQSINKFEVKVGAKVFMIFCTTTKHSNLPTSEKLGQMFSVYQKYI